MMIRDAKGGDLDALAELMGHVQAVHAQMHPDIFKGVMEREAVKAFFADTLAKPDHFVLVHDDAGTTNGYVWFEVIDRPENLASHARFHGYINHISVAPDARHGGIGKALVEEVRERLREHGVNKVGVDYWAFNTRASQFFAKLGFTPQRQVAFATL